MSDSGLLEGKVAIITGAGTGIGAAVAEAFADEGAHVLLVGRRRMPLNRIAKRIHDRDGLADVVRADVGRPAEVRCLFERAKRFTGSIDIVVNNAGILGPRVPLLRYSLKAWDEVMRANARGVFIMMQESLRNMRKRGGSIINVSSGVGRQGRAEWGAYSASKFVVEALTQISAAENENTGIRVNAVNPGAMRTGMRAKAYPKEDPSRLPAPEDAVPAFLYLASDASKGVNGESIDAQEFEWPE